MTMNSYMKFLDFNFNIRNQINSYMILIWNTQQLPCSEGGSPATLFHHSQVAGNKVRDCTYVSLVEIWLTEQREGNEWQGNPMEMMSAFFCFCLRLLFLFLSLLCFISPSLKEELKEELRNSRTICTLQKGRWLATWLCGSKDERSSK